MAKRANGANEEEEPQEGNTEVTVAPRVLPEGAIPARHGGWFRPFQPGQSGNPSGYGGAYAEARRICAQASGDAARRQVELMASDDERVALMATEAVLNRGAGKPRDHSAEERRDVQADLSALSPDERTTLARLLATALGVEKKW